MLKLYLSIATPGLNGLRIYRIDLAQTMGPRERLCIQHSGPTALRGTIGGEGGVRVGCGVEIPVLFQVRTGYTARSTRELRPPMSGHVAPTPEIGTRSEEGQGRGKRRDAT